MKSDGKDSTRLEAMSIFKELYKDIHDYNGPIVVLVDEDGYDYPAYESIGKRVIGVNCSEHICNVLCNNRRDVIPSTIEDVFDEWPAAYPIGGIDLDFCQNISPQVVKALDCMINAFREGRILDPCPLRTNVSAANRSYYETLISNLHMKDGWTLEDIEEVFINDACQKGDRFLVTLLLIQCKYNDNKCSIGECLNTPFIKNRHGLHYQNDSEKRHPMHGGITVLRHDDMFTQSMAEPFDYFENHKETKNAYFSLTGKKGKNSLCGSTCVPRPQFKDPNIIKHKKMIIQKLCESSHILPTSRKGWNDYELNLMKENYVSIS